MSADAFTFCKVCGGAVPASKLTKHLYDHNYRAKHKTRLSSQVRLWRSQHVNYAKKKCHDYYVAHKEKFKIYMLEYNRTHPRRNKNRSRMEAKYHIEYPTFWLCDLCSKPISGQNIKLDHDHKTGMFRGWLCTVCNTQLGVVEKWLNIWIVEIIERLRDYLILGEI